MSKKLIKLLVRSREDFQSMRKTNDNRIGMKADGTAQNIAVEMDAQEAAMLEKISTAAREQEKAIEKDLLILLKKEKIYTEWLKGVKGVGAIAAGWIISEYDIHIASTVSKMWQYTGLNPNLIRGKKRIAKDKYKPEHGQIVSELKDTETGEISDYIVQTNEMIRGDKLTAGFIAPFNKRLRVALVGVLADGFIKAQNEYCMKYYYPYKQRLEQSEILTEEITKKGSAPKQIKWSDCKKAHRDRAAKRYMIKMFLADLYANWRRIEGLEVRPTYHEEKLGHKHI
jgi:hypothetical protein